MANSKSSSNLRHFITPARAKEMTKKFKEMKGKLLKQEFVGKDILPVSETFENASMQVLLDQPGCVSFRTYLGMDENLEIRIIFVGVNDKDQDLLSETPDSGVVILEEGTRCPPFCPPPPTDGLP